MIPIPDVSDLDMAFGGKAMDILPPMSKIPAEFKATGFCSMGGKSHFSGEPGVTITANWLQVVSDWFYCGLKNAKWSPKPGVDTQKALRAIKACIGSFEPKHEHKEAGVAYLLSEWFDDVKYEKGKP